MDEDKQIILKQLVDSIEEMIDILEEKELQDEEFVIPREIAESLREELNEMI